MPTTIHLSSELVEWADREAARRGISRNRLISDLVACAMNERDDWSPNLFPRLVDSALAEQEPES